MDHFTAEKIYLGYIKLGCILRRCLVFNSKHGLNGSLTQSAQCD